MSANERLDIALYMSHGSLGQCRCIHCANVVPDPDALKLWSARQYLIERNPLLRDYVSHPMLSRDASRAVGILERCMAKIAAEFLAQVQSAHDALRRKAA